MFWVAAFWIVASVANKQTIGNDAKSQFISDTMSTQQGVSFCSEATVPGIIDVSFPLPTFSFVANVDSAPKAVVSFDHRQFMPDTKADRRSFNMAKSIIGSPCNWRDLSATALAITKGNI